ncbi:BMA-NPP-6, isoform e [Aphelenchoides bicaudatus]|nr:BMA-NPP-6, isoform e [Aphelenchoides bicaudatus]
MKTSFTGAEIAFNHTYFSAKPDKIIEVKTDSPVHPLSLTEVPETAGSYSFTDDGLGFYNRTLFWRTESSRIYFNEICATQEVADASLCLDLHPTVIITGTTVTFYRGVLVIAIPTPSAIYRFRIRLSTETNAGHQSVLSFFPTSENYHSYFDCHYFPNGTTTSKASIAHDFYGNTVCVAANNKNQLVIVEMPIARQSGAASSKEFALSEGSVLGRLFKRNLDPTLGLTMAAFNSDLFVISAQSDGRLRIWSATDGAFKGVFEMSEHLRSDLEFDIDDLIIKASTCFGQRIIVIKIQLVKKVKFFVLSYENDELNLITTCDLYASSVVDFLFVESSAERQEITLWTISRESYDEDKPLDSMFQPYLLRHCALELNGTSESEWKVADPAVPNSILDSLVFESMTVESVKQRIFDGDTYSFEIVQRSIQTICKCPTIAVQYRDWHGLSCFTEEFVQSGQFIQMYLSEQDQNSLLTSNTIEQELLNSAYERFWLDVQKCCNQFQETSLYPIAVWYSPTLGLAGTIQSCRFTVYVDPDDRLQSLVLSQGNAVDTFFEIIKNYVSSNYQLTSTDCDQQMACKVKTDTLCRIVKWFSEREDDLDLNLVPMKSAYLESSFSTTLLATALRQRILSRLCFAKVISTIIKLLPEIFMLADKTFDHRSLSTISSQLSSISATVKHYNNLWFTLSSTYLKRSTASGKTSKLITIAQSFFKSGLPFSHDRSNFMDEDLDELRTDDGITPPRKNLPEFSGFVADALNDAMITLWPESKAMTFARFLVDNKYYDALREYCEKNHPYVSELSAAFYFFQGIACAGIGQPDLAATFFEEASQGVVSENEVLNGVLSTYTSRPYSHKHTLTDFYHVVMNVFKSQMQTEYVIRAGMFALKFSNDSDPILPTIYALMFNQYLESEQYFEAIRFLHMNPSKESQDNCLRNLVSTLWDTGRTKSLVDLHYAELTDRVAELLEAKCRSTPLLSDNGFFEAVYAFYMRRYNYEAAARIMYFLCWRLRWVPQSREVLERRLRVLSCICQTVEMLSKDFTISLEVDMKELMKTSKDSSFVNEIASGKFNSIEKEFSPENVDKKALYDEYLVLEGQLALLNSGDFPNGPPVNVTDIYEEAITHRLYDTAFVIQRHFHLDASRLFNSLALDCIGIGFDEGSEIPGWVLSNCRFVDYVNKEEDRLKPHWKLLVAYLDLTLKVESANVLVIQKVAELFLERSLEIPKWLETRYLKVNSRHFYQQLIEFDELEYALKVLLVQLNQCISRKIRPHEIHIIPVAHIDTLYKLALENSGQKPEVLEMMNQSKVLLTKIFRSMKMLGGHSAFSTSKSKKELTVQNEFFGVYCLISRSENPTYKNRCYVGYTVDPNRRVLQHNAGRQAGGANRTSNRGPWDMVCIVHGFPNSVSALRFEWAWQNPHKSKRVRDLYIQKNAKNETPFTFKLRTVCNMLNVDPWKRLALTFRWLLPENEQAFPIPLPSHLKVEYGLVQKTKTIVPREFTSYKLIEECSICGNRIKDLNEYMECLNDGCRAHYHMKCLCEVGLKQTDRLNVHLFPSISTCKLCLQTSLWGDLIRRQRCLISVENSKPSQDNLKIAEGLIPKVIQTI